MDKFIPYLIILVLLVVFSLLFSINKKRNNKKTNMTTKNMMYVVVFVVLAIILDLLTAFIPKMPMGGNFFGISMIPIVLVGLLFGVKYGLLAGFTFSLYSFSADYLIYLSTLKATLESWTGSTWSFSHILALVLLDYIIPFTGFGLAGLFSKNNLKKISNIIYAVLSVSLIRLISATLSGYLIWSSSIKYAVEEVKNGDISPNIATKIFESVNNNLLLYSAVYNSIYIVTTTISVIVILLITRKRIIDVSERITILDNNYQ